MQSYHDLFHAIKRLRRAPGFVITTVLTLTAVIAANAVVFGVLDSLVFRSLPVPNPNEVVQVQRSLDVTLSYPDYKDIRDRNQTFSDLAVYRLARIGLGAPGNTQTTWAYEVSGNYFGVLRLQPLLGRFLDPSDDEKRDGSQNAVISYSCWKTRFRGDPGVIGATVHINIVPYVIVGVAPKTFHGTEFLFSPELWVPVQNAGQIEGVNWLDDRQNASSWSVGRLKSGVTLNQANADLARVATLLSRVNPNADKGLALIVARPGLLGTSLTGPVHAFLYALMGLGLLVLVAACVNLGALFAARASDRTREIGIRLALGSTREHILLQLFAESAILAVISGAAASLIASLVLETLAAWHPGTEIPVQFFVAPSGSTIAFTMLIALLSTLLFGLVPAHSALQSDPNQVIKETTTSHRPSGRVTFRDVLLTVQLAVCCLLVTSSFVALRGLERTSHIPLGFKPEGVILASLDLHLAGYQTAQASVVQQRLLSAVQRIPGVERVAYSDTIPLSLNQNGVMIYAPGTSDFSLVNAKFGARTYSVSPDYFDTAGTNLLAGRSFSQHDDANTPRIAIVNKTFARKLFATSEVVGKHFPLTSTTQAEIVGLVEDGKYSFITEAPEAAIFWPAQQASKTDTVILMRSHRAPAELLAALKHAVASVDPQLPIFGATTWVDGLYLALFPARAAAVALSVLGALSLMLAITGIFGLTTYTVSRRMREMGIRLALGAQRRQVLQAAFGRTLVFLASGSLAGLALGLAISRALASLIYGSPAFDPLVILAAVFTMLTIAIVSSAYPAWRVLSIKPTQLLREQ